MKTGIGKLLQIAQGDRPMIGALLLQAAFTGIFVGALELEANAVFLESFGAGKVPLGIDDFRSSRHLYHNHIQLS